MSSSRFGVPLSRARAWSAAALMSWFLAASVVSRSDWPTPLELSGLVGSFVLAAGMALRRPWARSVMLGALAASLVWSVRAIEGSSYYRAHALAILLPDAVLAALLVPWRRRELTRDGVLLACLTAAWEPLWFRVSAGDLAVHAAAVAALAVGAAGHLARARWTPVAFVVGAAVLALGPSSILDHGQDGIAHAIAGGALAVAALLCARDALARTGAVDA